MGFVFRLDKVLRYRRRLVEEHSRLVAEAGRAVAATTERLRVLENDLARLGQNPLAETGSSLDIQDFQTKTQWLQHLQEIRRILLAELEEATREMETRRMALSTAYQELEVLDRLRTRRKDEWKTAEAKRELREMDEVAQIKAARSIQTNLSH